MNGERTYANRTVIVGEGSRGQGSGKKKHSALTPHILFAFGSLRQFDLRKNRQSS